MPRMPLLHKLQENPTFRFTLPVLMENTFTIFIGLLFSSIISSISGSALAAIGMANTVMAMVTSFFGMLTTGAAVLISRQIGARENQEAGRTIEQATLAGVVSTLVVALVCIVCAPWILKLLMATAEEQLFREAVRYFRILMLSMPMLILHSVHSGASRAVGDSRTPMVVAVVMNIAQIVFAYLFIVVFGWQEVGAGLAYVCCRALGCGIMLNSLLRDHRFFVLRIKNMLKVHWETIFRILRIGIPVCIEGIFVQLGYMLANSMSIALGTLESGVYQIMNTLNSFIGLPQGICAAVAMSTVGRLLGAQDYKQVKKTGRLIWLVGIGASALLGGIVVVFASPLSSIYSDDPAAIAMCGQMMWILLVMDIAGCSINAIDSQLRAGGDTKYVMMTSLLAVWLIRLPLTYLFCFILDWGVLGIYGANTLTLYLRALAGFIRHCGSKWMTRRV